MAPKKVQKSAAIDLETLPFPAITLGEELFVEIDELAPSSLPANDAENASPAIPTNEYDESSLSDKDRDKDKAKKLHWSDEMLEQLVEVLHQVFENRGATDNSFKKATFEKAAGIVRKVYNGLIKITHKKCKNK